MPFEPALRRVSRRAHFGRAARAASGRRPRRSAARAASAPTSGTSVGDLGEPIPGSALRIGKGEPEYFIVGSAQSRHADRRSRCSASWRRHGIVAAQGRPAAARCRPCVVPKSAGAGDHVDRSIEAGARSQRRTIRRVEARRAIPFQIQRCRGGTGEHRSQHLPRLRHPRHRRRNADSGGCAPARPCDRQRRRAIAA